MDDRTTQLYNRLGKCKDVIETLKTRGWLEILKPSIESQIYQLSGKLHSNGLFSTGSISTSENKEREIGIHEGMVRVYNLINGFISEADKIERAIKKLEEPETTVPPMRGSKYDLRDNDVVT